MPLCIGFGTNSLLDATVHRFLAQLVDYICCTYVVYKLQLLVIRFPHAWLVQIWEERQLAHSVVHHCVCMLT